MREEVQEFQAARVPRSRGPKDRDISKSHSNASLTLKKVHLVPFQVSYYSDCLVTYHKDMSNAQQHKRQHKKWFAVMLSG